MHTALSRYCRVYVFTINLEENVVIKYAISNCDQFASGISICSCMLFRHICCISSIVTELQRNIYNCLLTLTSVLCTTIPLIVVKGCANNCHKVSHQSLSYQCNNNTFLPVNILQRGVLVSGNSRWSNLGSSTSDIPRQSEMVMRSTR